jgi:hypothetical protein
LHLTTHPNRLKTCASKLSPEQYSIYDVDLILSWILDDNEPVEKVARFALNFVFERGLELKRVEEWANLWCSSIEEKGARRRIHQRREGRIKARPLPLPGHKQLHDTQGVSAVQPPHYPTMPVTFSPSVMF